MVIESIEGKTILSMLEDVSAAFESEGTSFTRVCQLERLVEARMAPALARIPHCPASEHAQLWANYWCIVAQAYFDMVNALAQAGPDYAWEHRAAVLACTEASCQALAAEPRMVAIWHLLAEGCRLLGRSDDRLAALAEAVSCGNEEVEIDARKELAHMGVPPEAVSGRRFDVAAFLRVIRDARKPTMAAALIGRMTPYAKTVGVDLLVLAILVALAGAETLAGLAVLLGAALLVLHVATSIWNGVTASRPVEPTGFLVLVAAVLVPTALLAVPMVLSSVSHRPAPPKQQAGQAISPAGATGTAATDPVPQSPTTQAKGIGPHRLPRPTSPLGTLANQTVTVANPKISYMNLRLRPEAEAPVVGKANNGAAVRVVEQRGDWARVLVPGGHAGWMRWRLSSGLELVRRGGPTTAAPPPTAGRLGDSGFTRGQHAIYRDRERQPLKLRGAPSSGATVVASLPYETRLTVLEQRGDWLRVEVNGRQGWCAWRRPGGGPEYRYLHPTE